MHSVRTHPFTDVTFDYDAAHHELHLALVTAGVDPDTASADDVRAAIAVAARTFADHDPRVTDVDRALQFCAQLHRATRATVDRRLADAPGRAVWSLDIHARNVVHHCIEWSVADMLTKEFATSQT